MLDFVIRRNRKIGFAILRDKISFNQTQSYKYSFKHIPISPSSLPTGKG